MTVILQYKQWRLHLISDDNQFRLLSKAYGIFAHTSDEFIQSHKSFYKSLDLRSENRINSLNGIETQNIAANHFPNNKNFSKNSNSLHISSKYADNKISDLNKYGFELSAQEQNFLLANQIRYFKDLEGLTEEKIKSLSANKKLVFAQRELTDHFDDLLKIVNSLE